MIASPPTPRAWFLSASRHACSDRPTPVPALALPRRTFGLVGGPSRTSIGCASGRGGNRASLRYVKSPLTQLMTSAQGRAVMSKSFMLLGRRYASPRGVNNREEKHSLGGARGHAPGVACDRPFAGRLTSRTWKTQLVGPKRIAVVAVAGWQVASRHLGMRVSSGDAGRWTPRALSRTRSSGGRWFETRRSGC